MILHSDGIAAETEHIRDNATLCDATGLAVFEVTGKDSADYLHRMLSNSVKTLKTGEGCSATALRGDGRMVASLLVCAVEPRKYLLLTPLAARSGLFEQLTKYIIMEDVQIRDETDSTSTLAIDGPKVTRILSTYATSVTTLDVGGSISVQIAGNSCLIIRSDAIGVTGFSLLCDADSISHIRDELEASGIAHVGSDARHIIRVENGIPQFGIDMDETTIPLEANLAAAIDFSKGCFPGQEIVARINNLGHPAKKLVGLRLPQILPAGTELYSASKKAGKITSVAQSPRYGAIGLGIVKWELREGGTRLSLSPSDDDPEVTVADLPFSRQ